MAREERTVRIPLNFRLENPEHARAYEILKKQKNKSAFIRQAVIEYQVLADGETDGGMLTAPRIRKIIREENERMLKNLSQRKTGQEPG